MMSNSDSFQQRYSFEERQLKAREYLSKFSDSVPVILQRTKNTQNLPSIAEEKYVVKRDSNLVTFNRIVIKKLKEEALIDEVKSLFLILQKEDGKIEKMTTHFDQLYDKYKSSDGFLYIYYSDVPSYG